MGLFDKKTFVCERCGKEYVARIAVGAHICGECLAREAHRMENVKGYIDYAARMHWKPYTEEQLDEIARHRDAILEKCRMEHGISRAELTAASDNYKSLSDEQAEDVLKRVSNSTVHSTLGAAYCSDFFVPVDYERTIVDKLDIFAVGYTSDPTTITDGKNETILCAVFTNDPYLPVFPVAYAGKLKLFELLKSKKGREDVSGMFELLCPNLTYPVQDLKQLKKQIKKDGEVKGNIDPEFMLERISDASLITGIFKTKKIMDELPPSSVEMLDEYGYIPDFEINRILKMDKMFNRGYWTKQSKRIAESG